jgi:lipopolysaccharide transport system permease protein
MMMVIFTVVFGYLAKIPSDGVPYPVFALVALLPWQLFSHALQESSNSLIANQSLVTKVYFPRLLIPLSPILSGLLDFVIAFVMLLVLLLYYGITPRMNILALPFFVLFALVTALSVGLWLSALNVKYRDVRYTVPFLTQIWLYCSPVAYSTNLIPEHLRWLYGLNPLAGVIEGFRWALFGHFSISISMLMVSIAAVGVLFFGGLFYFSHMERTFADLV